MEEYRLGICDSDTGYMLGLMDYMNMSIDIPFHVSVFTRLQDMDREMEAGRIDMLLVDSSMEIPEKIAVEIKKKDMPLVRLTETRDNPDNQEYIFKYQRAEDMSETLSRIAKRKIKLGITGCGGFYGVYSPYGRCGTSTYALRLASETDNSLLVKLENFRGISGGEDDSFMYYLLSHNEAIGGVIRAMQKKDGTGLRIVEGPLSYQDIRELKQADICWFKDYMQKGDCCESVVFDIGSGVLGNFDILLAFDTVYVIRVPGADGKLESFKKTIGYGNGIGYEKILKFVDMEE